MYDWFGLVAKNIYRLFHVRMLYLVYENMLISRHIFIYKFFFFTYCLSLITILHGRHVKINKSTDKDFHGIPTRLLNYLIYC
jgi:hypothetical protein